jgi:hypothetical protein
MAQPRPFKHIHYFIFQLPVVLNLTAVILKHTIMSYYFIVIKVLILFSFFAFTIYPSWDMSALFLEQSSSNPPLFPHHATITSCFVHNEL